MPADADAAAAAAAAGGELFKDNKTNGGFIRYYLGLQPAPDTVRIFDRKEFYTVHGADAEFVARRFFRTTAVLKTQNASGCAPLAGCVVNAKMLERVLRDLLVESADKSVEMYAQEGSGWALSRAASPGKLGAFEDVLFRSTEMVENPVLMAVKAVSRGGQRLVGVGFVDATGRRLGLGEFLDDDHFNSLETVAVQLGCKECLVPAESAGGAQGSAEGRRVREALERCGVFAREVARKEFSNKDLAQDMGRLGREGAMAHFGPAAESDAAGGALAAAIAYAEVLADAAGHGRFTIHSIELGACMRLDAAALRALNVLKQPGDGNAPNSLEALMNRARTPMGRRLCQRWLKQPLLDAEKIKERHDVVEALSGDDAARQSLRMEHLSRLSDIERLLARVGRRKAKLQDVVGLYEASMRLPRIADVAAGVQGASERAAALLQSRFVAPLRQASGADFLGKFESLVEAAVDLEALESEQREYLISAEYDEALGELKQKRDRVRAKIEGIHRAVASDLGLSHSGVGSGIVRLDHTSQYGFHLRITKKDEGAVRGRLKAYQSMGTNKDGCKFTSAELRRQSDLHAELSDEYQERQSELVKKVVDVAATFVDVFEEVASTVATLDVLAGFADLVAVAPAEYVRPEMTPMGVGDIVLEGCRHPCVEAQDEVSFIANDCKLKREDSWFQIITGPNMGGKSTYIRQIGCAVLMAQVGCFVPCSAARISCRDCIFARVGAGDCQLRGVSTFMAEMLEAAAILHKATPSSLVIIDELGRGTSTYDGFGLAWAISEHLADVTKAPTLFATHFYELTALAEGRPQVGNLHVNAHIDASTRRMTMLFKIAEGASDQSFGISCAEFAGFPKEVVEMAKEKARELEEYGALMPCDRLGSKRTFAAGPDEPATKRSRVEGDGVAAAAATKARAFLSEFAGIDMESVRVAAVVLRGDREGCVCARALDCSVTAGARASVSDPRARAARTDGRRAGEGRRREAQGRARERPQGQCGVEGDAEQRRLRRWRRAALSEDRARATFLAAL